MLLVNPWLGLTMSDELSHIVLCDVGVIAFALCPPGMMCERECPGLNPCLFVSLDGWFAASWSLLTYTETVVRWHLRTVGRRLTGVESVSGIS